MARVGPIFKYFTAEAHARSFIRRGAFLLRPLSHFRRLEDGAVRGDRQDGQLRHAPTGGLVLQKTDGSRIETAGHQFVATPAREIFVFCASNQRSDDLARRFAAPLCVAITDVDALIERIKARANPASSLDYGAMQQQAVEYRDQTKEPGADWALPDKLTFIKPPAFAWQDEYRIAIGLRGAFDVHAVNCVIEADAGAAPVAVNQQPPSETLRFRLGNLGDIAILHDLSAAPAKR